MNPTQTGIAVALALAVVIFFFVFNGMSLFSISTQPSQEVTIETATTTNSNAPTTMPTENVTQLQVTDEVVGTGAVAAVGNSVTVNYVGSFTNGTVFDASSKHPETANGFTFTLGAGNVIKGWDDGVVGMKVGGKRKLVVPPSLGYGPNDYGSIPGNSTLIFEVELLKVQK
ncbi:MAG: FKBP-type peptidyl-prolyl cis-trans isomerase [Candidatus Kaiserbacteria bacterium]|nr:FKBP-type peptidyl-prolyl cis-trans isomerase [Candidatus Kaiserbacteria bacterium]